MVLLTHVAGGLDRLASPPRRMSTRLKSTLLRGFILGMGRVVFVSAVSWIVTFPIRLSI